MRADGETICPSGGSRFFGKPKFTRSIRTALISALLPPQRRAQKERRAVVAYLTTVSALAKISSPIVPRFQSGCRGHYGSTCRRMSECRRVRRRPTCAAKRSSALQVPFTVPAAKQDKQIRGRRMPLPLRLKSRPSRTTSSESPIPTASSVELVPRCPNCTQEMGEHDTIAVVRLQHAHAPVGQDG